MNKLLITGRLTREPEVRVTTDNKTVAKFSLAVNRRFKKDGEPDADFFNCTAFDRIAEIVEKYLRKGSKILVEGEVHSDKYTNKDGQTVYSTNVIVNSLEFAESKKNDGFIPNDEELPFQ